MSEKPSEEAIEVSRKIRAMYYDAHEISETDAAHLIDALIAKRIAAVVAYAKDECEAWSKVLGHEHPSDCKTCAELDRLSKETP